MFPHENCDKAKDDLRKDSATAQFDVIRFLCSVATILGIRLGFLSVKDVYLLSGPIKRENYVRPLRECAVPIGIIWKFVKVPYGVTEAGRQWATVFEGWLLKQAGFYRVVGVPICFLS